MKLLHTTGCALFGVLMVFTGTFALHGDLRGQAPSDERVPVAVSTVTEARADAAEVPDKAPVRVTLYRTRIPPHRMPVLPPELIDSETLWLARCIFSESKDPAEQELVAWVVRNRVETAYRGSTTYRDVILDPYQFSAFNPQSRSRNFYMSLSPVSRVAGWQRALSIAHHVRHASPSLRPFDEETRHFYSEESMIGRSHPEWAEGLSPVTLASGYEVDERRFRFYADIY